jgi:putative ABC transport system substrate-binding protein
MGTEMVKKYLAIFFLLLLIISDNLYSKDKIVAVIVSANLEKFNVAYSELKRRLAETKKDLQIQLILSNPNPDPVSWANALKRAEGMEVDVIITFGAPLAYTALREKVSTPIIYVDVYEKNIFDTFKTKNITGLYNAIPVSTVIKNLCAIKKITKLHVLYCPFEKETEIEAKRIKEMLQQINLDVELHPLKSPENIYEINVKNTDAMFLTTSVILESGITKIAEYAIKKEIPLVGISETVTNGGGFICVAPDPKGQGRQLTNFLINYIETKNLPKSEQVKDVNFVLNMKTAKLINLTIPLHVLNNVTKIVK